jgi:trigger factor
MKTNWTLQEKSTGELTVLIDGDVWKKAQEKAFDKLAKNVEIDGFRKGSAPKSIVEKHLKPEAVLMEAMEATAQDALLQGVEENNIELISRPTLDLNELDEEKVEYKFTIVTRPEVTLGAYKDLGIEVEKVEVTEQEVDERLESLREQYAELNIKEDAIKSGDTAIIDFEGFLNDVAFEGGKGENYPLEIGSNSFIPGFEDQLIGCKTGEEKDITVTFPEEYQAEDLAGKEVVFKIKVNEVKERVLPELDDDFAKDVDREGIITLVALKEELKKELLTDKENIAKEEADNKILTTVTDNATVEIPDVMIEEETDSLVEDFKYRLQAQGFPYEQFLQMTGQDEATLREQMAKDAESKVKLRLVLTAIAKEENLEVSADEIEAEYKTVADMHQMEVEKVKELLPVTSLMYDLRIRKAFDFVKDAA